MLGEQGVAVAAAELLEGPREGSREGLHGAEASVAIVVEVGEGGLSRQQGEAVAAGFLAREVAVVSTEGEVEGRLSTSSICIQRRQRQLALQLSIALYNCILKASGDSTKQAQVSDLRALDIQLQSLSRQPVHSRPITRL